jgi:hypothetical protein
VTWEGSRLTHKHYTGLERPVRSKHCSLLGQFVGYKEKKFCEYVPINSVVEKDSQIFSPTSSIDILLGMRYHISNHDFLSGLMHGKTYADWTNPGPSFQLEVAACHATHLLHNIAI